MILSLSFRNQNIFTSTALNAKSEADLTRAGKHFSSAIAMIGVNVVIEPPQQPQRLLGGG